MLASTGEPASISVIESMFFCVPSLSGTDNGTADYIRPGITGEVFRNCDEDELYKKLSGMLANPVSERAAPVPVCQLLQRDPRNDGGSEKRNLK